VAKWCYLEPAFRTLESYADKKVDVTHVEEFFDNEAGEYARKQYFTHADLKLDGVYGPTLNILQGNWYIEICERNPSQEQFFFGWVSNRVVMWLH